MGRACGTYDDRGVEYKCFMGKPERKNSFGVPKCRRENSIRKDFQEIGRGAWTEFIFLRTGTLRAFVNIVMNILLP
jgi:hypothetical protein